MSEVSLYFWYKTKETSALNADNGSSTALNQRSVLSKNPIKTILATRIHTRLRVAGSHKARGEGAGNSDAQDAHAGHPSTKVNLQSAIDFRAL